MALVPARSNAEVKTPVLMGTNPESPGVSIHPLVHGRDNGAITSVLTRSLRLGSTGSGGESVEVRIYTDPACQTGLLGSGSREQFEGQGIEVTVAPQATTTLYADETDGTETSGCSSGLVYKQVGAPPTTPTVESVTPTSPANDNFPLVSGTADDEATVALYGNAGCSGSPLATGSAASFGGPGIATPVPDDSTTTFYASASWAGMTSGCSTTSVRYEEVSPVVEEASGGEVGESFEVGNGGGQADGGGGGPAANPPPVSTARPPVPRLLVLSGALGNLTTPTVGGSADGAAQVVIYQQPGCKGGASARASASQFTSGIQVTVPENATTQFYALSISGSGIYSECTTEPAAYTEDSLAPVTRFTFGPGRKTRKHKVAFRFADPTEGPPGTTFACKVDRKRWRACGSPLRLKKLHRGKHVVKVRATDAAGNWQRRPSVRRFKVIRRRPRPSAPASAA